MPHDRTEAAAIDTDAARPGSDDLADLRSVVEGVGPFATVHLLLQPEEVDAAERLDVRIRNATGTLAGAGAPEDVVAAVDAALRTEPNPDGGTLAVVATTAGVRHRAVLAPEARVDLAEWAPLPRLTALVEARQAAVPHVVVLIDRTGADVIGVVGDDEQEARQVRGDSAPITKVHAGGWSDRRYDQRAESSWEENAGQVGTAVEQMAARVGAAFVAVAGDVRATALLRDALPAELAARVQEVDGTRHPDGSEDETAEALDRLVATASATVTAATLRDLRAEEARQGAAAAGPDDVLAALAETRVDVLLVHDDPDDDRTAWFGPEAPHVGADRATVAAMGVEDPQEGRLVDVAVRSALLSGAAVRVVPRTVDGGLGALLRWA